MSVQSRTTAVQNEVVRLYCTFERDGRLMDPAGQPVIEILDTDGATVYQTLYATQESMGIWYVDWYVPATLPLGDYYDRWSFQWQSTSGVTELVQNFTVYGLDSYINFINPGISQYLDVRVIQLLKDLTNDFVYEAQHIPVYWEAGMRVQQENQAKRVMSYYYFTLDADHYNVSKQAIYTNNNQKFTVFSDLVSIASSSSSSYSSSSSSIDSRSSSSSSSFDSESSPSSESSNSSSSSSSSSESVGNNSSSTSSQPVYPTTTTTTTWVYQPVLTCTGTGAPTNSGVLTKVYGEGPATINFISYMVKQSQFSTKYNFAFGRWLKDPRPVVRVNNRIIDDGWYSDYNGNLFFDRLMAPEDSVSVKYKWSYFSDEEMLGFLDFGLSMMNSMPPASTVYNSLVGMPGEWNAPVLLYAAILALKRLIFGLSFQEQRIVYGRPEDAQAAMAAFQNLYADYFTIWQEQAKNAKTRKLPSISQFITPEYTLPGGRCLSEDTCIKYKIGDEEFEKTVKEMFGAFEKGMSIEVLSMVDGGRIGYSGVKKIWKSGRKQTYVVRTKDASIRLTKEHLVYIPDEDDYRSVMSMVKSDRILVLKNNRLVKQELIEDPILYGKESVYDLEVPETGNFIGNNVVSHNSRWFRYLYKGGSG